MSDVTSSFLSSTYGSAMMATFSSNPKSWCAAQSQGARTCFFRRSRCTFWPVSNTHSFPSCSTSVTSDLMKSRPGTMKFADTTLWNYVTGHPNGITCEPFLLKTCRTSVFVVLTWCVFLWTSSWISCCLATKCSTDSSLDSNYRAANSEHINENGMDFSAQCFWACTGKIRLLHVSLNCRHPRLRLCAHSNLASC